MRPHPVERLAHAAPRVTAERDQDPVERDRVDLAIDQLVVVPELQRVEHHGEVAVEELDLRSLVPVQHVLDRQGVQLHHGPQRRQVVLIRLLCVDPDTDLLVGVERGAYAVDRHRVDGLAVAVHVTGQHVREPTPAARPPMSGPGRSGGIP